jgi:hypothetical protein
MTRFAGYAAVFDVPDRGGDVVRRGRSGSPGRCRYCGSMTGRRSA